MTVAGFYRSASLVSRCWSLFIQRCSPLWSILTALACDYTWVTSFFTFRKTTLNRLEKTTTATKSTWVLPICDQHGVYEALSRRRRHGRKSKVLVSRTVVCLLLSGSHASNVRQPSGPVPGAAAVRVHHRPVRCSQDTCDWRQTGEHPFFLQSTPKETTVSRHTTCSPPDWGLGPYNRALSWGRQVIKHSKSATNLTPWQYIELSESYVILTRKTKYVLRNLRSGGWSPFKTYIIVLGTPQGVSLFTVSLQLKEPLQLQLSTNIMPQTCESSWTPSPLM